MEEHTHEGETLPCGCPVKHDRQFGRKRGMKTFLLLLVVELGLIVVLLALAVGLAFSRGGGGGGQVRQVPIVSPYNGTSVGRGGYYGGVVVPQNTGGSSSSGTGTPTGTTSSS